jgi:hypothetical protein
MFYYDVYRSATSNATPNTEDNLLALRTAANQRTAAIFGLYVSGRHNTAGGVVVRLKTTAVISTGGAAVTPGKRDPDAPAAVTAVVDSTFTDGTTPTVRQIVGVAAQGGFGGWFAATPEQALVLKPNGGATGNAELHDIAAVASVPFESNLEFAEI